MVVIWPSGPVSVICPVRERPIGVRDRRLRLLAGEPAEFRAADADAGQDPAFVLLAPCVQGAGADADGEQEAHDERDAEAEEERPSARRPCGDLVGGHGGYGEQDGLGVDAGLGIGPDERRELGVADGRRRVRVVPRCVAPDERRELGVAGGRLAVGCGGVGSPVGCGVGPFLGHYVLMRGGPALGCVPGNRDIFAPEREFVTPRSPRPSGLGRGTSLRRYAAGPRLGQNLEATAMSHTVEMPDSRINP